jgi:hypothetical protein
MLHISTLADTLSITWGTLASSSFEHASAAPTYCTTSLGLVLEYALVTWPRTSPLLYLARRNIATRPYISVLSAQRYTPAIMPAKGPHPPLDLKK